MNLKLSNRGYYFHARVNDNLTAENHPISFGRMWITTGSVRSLDLPATKLMSVLPCHRTLLAAVSSASSHDTGVMMGSLGSPLSHRQQCWYRIRRLPSLQRWKREESINPIQLQEL